MILQELLDTVISRNLLTPSRIPPLRTAVKQYAAMLGVDPSRCPPALYHLPERDLVALITAKAPARLGPHALRNLRNNLRYLLRLGVELGLLVRLRDPVQSWRHTRRPESNSGTPRHEGMNQTRYRLHPLPDALAHDLEAYLTWCGSGYAPQRPSRITKRATSQELVRLRIGYLAGYAVHTVGLTPEPLTLHALTDPQLVDGFTAWWVARRGKVTSTIHHMLTDLLVITRYWLKDLDRTSAIQGIRRSLPAPESVRDKRLSWLSLKELESIGLSRYPLNAKRIIDYRHVREIQAHLRNSAKYSWLMTRGSLTTMALWVEMSLLLRLWVRIPLRARNMCEMALGRNLIQHPDGSREIIFRGRELKVAKRDGRENMITHPFPPGLVGLLEEWLTSWRPRLAPPGEPHLFVNTRGGPFNTRDLNYLIKRTTFKFSGVAVNPHRIRDIWATEYIKSTRDVAGAAYMLGDTVPIVLKHYAHLLDAEAGRRATNWLESQLS
jgi:integrase